MPAQIAVLLAMTANLFDAVPIEKMTDAQHAVQQAASGLPADMGKRFGSGAKLSDQDRAAVIEVARNALAPFQPKPPAGQKP